MRNLHICSLFLASTSIVGAAAVAKAQFVFGSFEGDQSNGFGSFNNGVVPFASDNTGTTYAYSSIGATNGSVALDVITPNSGSIQSDLAFDFAANGDTSQFMNNDILSFDVSAEPAGATYTAGYQHVYQVVLNAPGGGYTQQGSAPVTTQYYYGGFGGSTQVVSINYDAFKSDVTANPGYLQLVIGTQTGGGAPGDMYFDNFTLSPAPEPASLGMLAVGGLAVLRRRRMA